MTWIQIISTFRSTQMHTHTHIRSIRAAEHMNSFGYIFIYLVVLTFYNKKRERASENETNDSNRANCLLLRCIAMQRHFIHLSACNSKHTHTHTPCKQLKYSHGKTNDLFSKDKYVCLHYSVIICTTYNGSMARTAPASKWDWQCQSERESQQKNFI